MFLSWSAWSHHPGARGEARRLLVAELGDLCTSGHAYGDLMDKLCAKTVERTEEAGWDLDSFAVVRRRRERWSPQTDPLF